MGKCCTKPCKRWAFARGERIAEHAVQKSKVKYTQKQHKKLRKLGLDVVIDTEFERTLMRALQCEKGLAHGKVREYWVFRAPRLFIVIIGAMCATLVSSELLKQKPEDDRVYVIVNGMTLLCLSAYMLYQRLPDAINSAMLRRGHDVYMSWKSCLSPRVGGK